MTPAGASGALFRLELGQLLRMPVYWVFLLVFAFMGYSWLAIPGPQSVLLVGNEDVTSAVRLSALLANLSVNGLLVIPILASAALLRDFETGVADLVFVTPVRKFQYLSGRAAAVLVVSTSMYLVAAFAMLAGQFVQAGDAEYAAPVRIMPLVWSLCIAVIPNLLFIVALSALLALWKRSLPWVAVGCFVTVALSGISTLLVKGGAPDVPFALLDPMGLSAISATAKYWTLVERNDGNAVVTALMLANRAIWLTVSMLLLWLALVLLKQQHDAADSSSAKARRRATSTSGLDDDPSITQTRISHVEPRFNVLTNLHQLYEQWRAETAAIVVTRPFWLMLVGLALTVFGAFVFARSRIYLLPVYPLTSQVTSSIYPYCSLFITLLLVFYAGQSVFRERETGVASIGAAFPLPGWAHVLAKLGALVVVIGMALIMTAVVLIGCQWLSGVAIEPLLHLQQMAATAGPLLMVAMVALAVPMLLGRKYLAFAALLILIQLASQLQSSDVVSRLYIPGSVPPLPHSDMNGYGHFVAPYLWFLAYWMLFGSALLVLASLAWVRSDNADWRRRKTQLGENLRGPGGVALATVTAAFVLMWGWLSWNVHVLNGYRPLPDIVQDAVQTASAFRAKEEDAQPKVIASHSMVDLWPERQSMNVDLALTVRNDSQQPMSTIRVDAMDGKALVAVDMGGQRLVEGDAQSRVRRYALQQPLRPGEQRVVRLKLQVEPRGIPNDTAQNRLVGNGTFIDSMRLPVIGYRQPPVKEEGDEAAQKAEQSVSTPGAADLQDGKTASLASNGEWIDFSSTVCTAPDQIAIAPGILKREYLRAGRRCFEYETERPIDNFYAFLSARWKVRRGHYKSIPIEVYYDPKHPFNVDRMIQAARQSLAYYEQSFGPYQYRQVRILEFPGYAKFAQSFPGVVPYSESMGFIADMRGKHAMDHVTFVTAHEIAHQWWDHQIVVDRSPGSTFLVESLAQYSALMVIEKKYGYRAVQRILRQDLSAYLRGRAEDVGYEAPLSQVRNDQQYIHYTKGSLALYRLREMLGEDAVNRALRDFVRDRGYMRAPMSTSRDLLAYLRGQARPDQQQLVTDLLEKITLYDSTVQDATAKRRADGKYEVSLKLAVRKVHADEQGRETPAPLDDWVDLVVGGRTAKGGARKLLFDQRILVRAPVLEKKVVVDGLPEWVGFDLYGKLIDRDTKDNRKDVVLQ